MKSASDNDIASSLYLVLKDKSGKEMEKTLKDSVSFLYRRGLLSKSDGILSRLEKIENAKKGIVSAKVSSAKPLAPDKKNKLIEILKRRYSAKEIEMKETEDKSLLSGWKIEANGEIIDASIRGKIKKLQAHLTI